MPKIIVECCRPLRKICKQVQLLGTSRASVNIFLTSCVQHNFLICRLKKCDKSSGKRICNEGLLQQGLGEHYLDIVTTHITQDSCYKRHLTRTLTACGLQCQQHAHNEIAINSKTGQLERQGKVLCCKDHPCCEMTAFHKII